MLNNDDMIDNIETHFGLNVLHTSAKCITHEVLVSCAIQKKKLAIRSNGDKYLNDGVK